jgi:hypothetical protein
MPRTRITTLLMIGRMIAPSAQMMLLASGPRSENYVFR